MRRTTKQMRMPALVLAMVSLVALPVSAAGVDAEAAFEMIKGLAGDWQGTAAGEAGAEVDYRVTGNGSVVMQTQFPGTKHEMISMYHLVDGELVLTHYCASGNQPQLKLDPAASRDGELAFVFAGGTNLDPEKDSHIHQAKIRIGEDGGLEEVWTGYDEGEAAHQMVFELSRAE
jgi:hypothetical protein